MSLWICFPVWRELKQSDFLDQSVLSKKLWICFPVWRELKQEANAFSRNASIADFGSAFPFEGNWNCIDLWDLYRLLEVSLWICFPVWRELKRCSFVEIKCCFGLALDLLSRLKGIETRTREHLYSLGVYLWICFPVWRELKLTAYHPIVRPAPIPLDLLSRLKGIETYWILCVNLGVSVLWICFPVWRELKPSDATLENFSIIVLWIGFPVWRELKLR